MATALPEDIIIRGMRASDVARVINDWLRSLRDAPGYRQVPPQTYHHWHHAILESLLLDPTVAWLVACPPDKPDLILGWACAQAMANGPMILHYVYVAKTFRRMRMGFRLLATLGLERDQGLLITAYTNSGLALLGARGNAPLYNPYLLWGRSPIGPVPTERRKDFESAMKRSRKASRVGHSTTETPNEAKGEHEV